GLRGEQFPGPSPSVTKRRSEAGTLCDAARAANAVRERRIGHRAQEAVSFVASFVDAAELAQGRDPLCRPLLRKNAVRKESCMVVQEDEGASCIAAPQSFIGPAEKVCFIGDRSRWGIGLCRGCALSDRVRFGGRPGRGRRCCRSFGWQGRHL